MKKILLIFMTVLLNSTVAISQTSVFYTAGSPSLNLRKNPDTNSEKVTSIPFNSKVILLEKKSEEVELNGLKGKWAKISFNNKKGWVFNPYLSYHELDSGLWKKVSELNNRAKTIKNESDLQELFIASIDSKLLNGLSNEFEKFRNDSFNNDDFYNIDYMVNKVIPVKIIIAGESNSFCPDVLYFKSKSKPGTAAYNFYSLCEDGFIGPDGAVYGGIRVFPLWYKQQSSFQGSPDKTKTGEFLKKWKQISPSLKGIYKITAQNTIKHLTANSN